MRMIANFSAKERYHAEIKAGKKSSFLIHSFMLISILSMVLLLFLYMMSSPNFAGFVSYIESQAGYITGVNVHIATPVDIWAGFYGLALTVPGITDQFYEVIDAGTIERFDVFFDCIQSDAPGGPEIYASTATSLNFASVTPANLSAIDSFIGCSGEIYCANETFIRNTSVIKFSACSNLSQYNQLITFMKC